MPFQPVGEKSAEEIWGKESLGDSANSSEKVPLAGTPLRGTFGIESCTREHIAFLIRYS